MIDEADPALQVKDPHASFRSHPPPSSPETKAGHVVTPVNVRAEDTTYITHFLHRSRSLSSLELHLDCRITIKGQTGVFAALPTTLNRLKVNDYHIEVLSMPEALW